MRHRTAIRHYMDNSTQVFRIPDIDNGFIPQGIAYDAGNDRVLLTGYMGGFGNSPLYVIDKKNGESKQILMRMEDGTSFRGHAGGIAVYRESAYVAGSTAGCMYRFLLDDLMHAPDGATLRVAERIELKNGSDRIRVSFTATDDDYLYAGEFHKAPLFYTHSSHSVETDSGRQKAYLFGFVPDGAGGAEPARVYSIPDNVQGACFYDGYLYLSQTESLFSSCILSYSLADIAQSGTKEVLGVQVPLYVLTPDGAVKKTRIPPMSEEILVMGDSLYVVYESASNRYRFGKRTGTDYVLATPLSFFR